MPHLLGVNAAHDSELQRVLGLAVGIGADIEHDAGAGAGRTGGPGHVGHWVFISSHGVKDNTHWFCAKLSVWLSWLLKPAELYLGGTDCSIQRQLGEKLVVSVGRSLPRIARRRAVSRR